MKKRALAAIAGCFFALLMAVDTTAQAPSHPSSGALSSRPVSGGASPRSSSGRSSGPSAGRTHPKNPVIDFGSLLNELTDRTRLARTPAGQWTLHHASSYDRRSVAKDQEGWYANNDWDNFIRKEEHGGRTEYVMLDTDGPGAVTRFWIAGYPEAKAGLRFYIDGQEQPFWEADHTGALIGRNKAIGAPLSQRSVEQDVLSINEGARPGHNLYAPIPFAKHLKVTIDKAPGGAENGCWYNIDYRIYATGTIVKSFSAATPALYAGALGKANHTLQAFMDAPASAMATAAPGGITKPVHSFSLAPGAALEWALPAGPASIRRILLSLTPGTLHAAVKDLWLQIDFDGNHTAEVPAGFLSGCGDQPLNAGDWYSKSDTLGHLASYWVMPYRQKAMIRLLNKGLQKLEGVLHADTGSWTWDDRSMYFHADFRRMDHFMTEKEKGQDFNYLDLPHTEGVYAGDRLQIDKPVGGWWGEGDEKIYIDGSSFPDDFGTGSEDYYGYAWGHPETFNHIFNAQPLGDANLASRGGTTVNSRMRSLDAIPFRQSLRFDMEAWNWHGGPVNMARACFWYELPDAAYSPAPSKNGQHASDGRKATRGNQAVSGSQAASDSQAAHTPKNPALSWEDLPWLRPGVQSWSHTSKSPLNRTVQDFLNYTTRETRKGKGKGDYELADFRGRPGMMVQGWWAFLPEDNKGVLKIYDSKSVSPRYSQPFAQYFNTRRFPHLLWESRDAIWWAFPCLSFSDRFKAATTAVPNWYQLTLHLYRESRFSESLSRTDLEKINRKMLATPGTFPGAEPGNNKESAKAILGAGESKTIFHAHAGGVIRQIWLQPPVTKDSLLPDSLFIRIRTNGETTAFAPVPFFFGSYPGVDPNHAKGLPAGFDGTGFYNFFPMPFWQGFTIELENHSGTPMELPWNVRWSDTNPYPRSSTGVFKVQYNAPAPVAAGQPDFVNLDVKGSGIIVGAVSHLTGAIEANFSFFVDGSHTPAIETTGGEDYFNHSYGIHPGFVRPFSGGLAEDIGYRFHIIDYIPFSNSLLFTQDHAIYQAHDRDGVFQSAVFYYYNPRRLLVLTDSIDIGQARSESGHAYLLQGTRSRLQTDTAFYEGNYSMPIVDEGRWTDGESRFTVSLDPANDGVRLRKRIEQTAYHQDLEVYVDGQPAGEWFEQGANYTLNRRLYYKDSLPDWQKGNLEARFRETEFEIPARLTRGRSSVTITLKTKGSLAVRRKDRGLTNEYYYWVYSYLP